MLNISPEVKDALSDKAGIVALESTIISHGLPHPDNLACALELEDRVRRHGAVPATIALADGKICIGLSKLQIEQLADPKSNVTKVSRRDFASVLSSGSLGATTVAGTMIAAHMSGIKVFATGGIGGVHRGAELNFDVSADLTELARSPVAVVCAGAKSILDLPKTLEVLETNGVPVIGYQTEDFPSFFSRSSGLPITQSSDNVDTLADLVSCQFELGLKTGMLIANPIPHEAAISSEREAEWIESALNEAKNCGIKGKEVTPFLLSRIRDLSGGASLTANLLLIRNNVDLASKLAIKIK